MTKLTGFSCNRKKKEKKSSLSCQNSDRKCCVVIEFSDLQYSLNILNCVMVNALINFLIRQGSCLKFNNDSKIAKATSHFLKLLIGFNKLHMQ